MCVEQYQYADINRAAAVRILKEREREKRK